MIFGLFKPAPTYAEYVSALRSTGFTPLSEAVFSSWPTSKKRRAIRDYTY